MPADMYTTIVDRKDVKVVQVSMEAYTFAVTREDGCRHWLVDSDCGVHMTNNEGAFASLTPWTGGAAQVGDGERCAAVGRGPLRPIVIRNIKNGEQTLLRPGTAWFIPTIVFSILSVHQLYKEGAQCNFGAKEKGMPPHYLRVHSSGVCAKLKVYRSIFVLPAVHDQQVHADLRRCVAASTATQPLLNSEKAKGPNDTGKYICRKHYDIDLWFVLGSVTPAATVIAVGSDLLDGEGVLGSRLGDIIPDAVDACSVLTTSGYDVGSVIENCDPIQLDATQMSRLWVDCAAVFQTTGELPARVFCASGAPSEHIIACITAHQGDGVHACSTDEDQHGAGECCNCAECENPYCVSVIAAVNRSSVNRTSPYYQAKSNIALQHARWGDAPIRRLYEMCKHGRVRGIDIQSCPRPCACRVCDLCKNQRSSIRPVAKAADRIQYEDQLETASMDYIGKMRVRSKPGQCQGAHLFTHFGCRKGSDLEPTRFVLTYPVRQKSQAPDCIRHAIHYLSSRFNRKVRHIQFDNAMEYKGQNMVQCQRELDWFATFSPKYTAVKNRNAEKTNHLICTLALCLMVRSSAPLWAWSMALLYATDIYNRLGKSGGGKSPLGLISGVVPDGSMLRVFWCPCSPLHFKEQGRGHFEPASRGKLTQPCRFVGLHPDQEDSWLYYDPERGVVDDSAHMHFDESHYDGSRTIFGEAPEVDDDAFERYIEGLGLETIEDADATDNQSDEGDTSSDDDGPISHSSSSSSASTADRDRTLPPAIARPGIDPPAQPNAVRRSQRDRRPTLQPQYNVTHEGTSRMGGYNVPVAPIEIQMQNQEGRFVGDSTNDMGEFTSNSDRTIDLEHVDAAIQHVQKRIAIDKAHEFADALLMAVSTYALVEMSSFERLADPLTHKEAMSRTDAAQWRGAMQDEMAAMLALGVWTVVGARHKVPKGKNIVRSKGVFKIKYLDTGEIDKWKYRLVACGYSQVYGADYTETHAGVVSVVVFRLFLGLIAALHLKTRLFDIGNAFLEGSLEEEIYMQLPSYLGGDVVLLQRAIYGLKQAGMIFVRMLAEFLRSLGFSQSKTEPCSFTLITKVADAPQEWNGYGYITVLTYVDDAPCGSNSDVLLDWLEAALKQRFRKVTAEPLRWFLSQRIVIERERGLVTVDQEQYCLLLIEKFRHYLVQHFSNADGTLKRVSVPMKPGLVPSKAQCPQTELEVQEMADIPYRELCGGLLYLANQTRVDILVATSNCAKFMSNYGWDHWLLLLEILLYLLNEPGRRICMRDQGPDRNLRIAFDADSSFADCPDTARSRWGVVGYWQGAFAVAKTGVFKNARNSTMDAETGALAQATLLVIEVRRYLADWGFPQYQPTPIGEDNNAALLFSKSPVASRRSRHIHVDHHVTREHQMEFRTIHVHRVPSGEMGADPLSKNPSVPLHIKHFSRIFGEQVEELLNSFLMSQTLVEEGGLCYVVESPHGAGYIYHA